MGKSVSKTQKVRTFICGVSLSMLCLFCAIFLFAGCNETAGPMWYSGNDVPTYSAYPGKLGDFYLDEDDSVIYKYTQDGWVVIGNLKGEDGQDGQTPTITIDTDGYWVINGEKTDVMAKGQDGTSPTVSINNDGYWVINGEPTNVKAKGEAGSYFYSGDTDPASELGKDGDVYLNVLSNDLFQKTDGTWTKIGNFQGSAGITPHIGENGNWWVGDTDTGYAAVGKNGESATISVDDNTGHLIINGEDTGYALGITSQDLYNNLQGIIEYDGGVTGFDAEYESVAGYEYLNQWEYGTSTFSGWAGSIGKPETINAIKFKVRAREDPITSIRVLLAENGYDGTLVAEGNVSVNVQPYETQDIVWQLDTPIVNTNDINYYFGYACDALVDKYGNVNSPAQQLPEAERSPSTIIRYITVDRERVDFNNFSPMAGNGSIEYAYIPVQVGELTGTFKLADATIQDILSKVEGELYKNSDIILPSTIYGYTGQTLQIYFRSICAYPLDDIYIKVNCAKGKQYTDRWEYTPESAESFDLTIEIYSKNWNLLESNTFSVEIKDTTTLTSVKALVIGDSTVAADLETQKVLDLAQTDEFDLTLLGTRGSGDNKHEGRGGWRVSTYVNNEKDSASIVNPFYNTSTSAFDFAYYMSEQSYDGVDIVFIQLGINDIFSSSTGTLQDAIDLYITGLQTMIDSIHSYDSNIKIVLNMIIPCDADQDSFTNTYGTSQTVWGFMRNMYKANQALLSNFSNQDNVYLSWYNAALDSINNQGGNVHPSTEGYNQLGTQMYYFLRAIL